MATGDIIQPITQGFFPAAPLTDIGAADQKKKDQSISAGFFPKAPLVNNTANTPAAPQDSAPAITPAQFPAAPTTSNYIAPPSQYTQEYTNPNTPETINPNDPMTAGLQQPAPMSDIMDTTSKLGKLESQLMSPGSDHYDGKIQFTKDEYDGLDEKNKALVRMYLNTKALADNIRQQHGVSTDIPDGKIVTEFLKANPSYKDFYNQDMQIYHQDDTSVENLVNSIHSFHDEGSAGLFGPAARLARAFAGVAAGFVGGTNQALTALTSDGHNYDANPVAFSQTQNMATKATNVAQGVFDAAFSISELPMALGISLLGESKPGSDALQAISSMISKGGQGLFSLPGAKDFAAQLTPEDQQKLFALGGQALLYGLTKGAGKGFDVAKEKLGINAENIKSKGGDFIINKSFGEGYTNYLRNNPFLADATINLVKDIETQKSQVDKATLVQRIAETTQKTRDSLTQTVENGLNDLIDQRRQNVGPLYDLVKKIKGSTDRSADLSKVDSILDNNGVKVNSKGELDFAGSNITNNLAQNLIKKYYDHINGRGTELSMADIHDMKQQGWAILRDRNGGIERLSNGDAGFKVITDMQDVFRKILYKEIPDNAYAKIDKGYANYSNTLEDFKDGLFKRDGEIYKSILNGKSDPATLDKIEQYLPGFRQQYEAINAAERGVKNMYNNKFFGGLFGKGLSISAALSKFGPLGYIGAELLESFLNKKIAGVTQRNSVALIQKVMNDMPDSMKARVKSIQDKLAEKKTISKDEKNYYDRIKYDLENTVRASAKALGHKSDVSALDDNTTLIPGGKTIVDTPLGNVREGNVATSDTPMGTEPGQPVAAPTEAPFENPPTNANDGFFNKGKKDVKFGF